MWYVTGFIEYSWEWDSELKQIRERWVDNYYEMRDRGALTAIPYPMRVVIGAMVYRSVASMLNGQGTGRYSADEVRAFKTEIWATINGLLIESRNKASDSKTPFWALGLENPTELDATLFGAVASTLVSTA